MRHGEVWWADLRKPVGRRPVLLLSRDSAYRVRRSVTVAPLTRTERRIPTEVALDRSDGVPAQCVVSLDDILAARDRLVAAGARVLGDGEPKIGAHGRPVVFIHPGDMFGTLTELEEV